MTSTNGGTYAGQYTCDGWVDKLEPTLFITIICFRIQRLNPKKTIHELPTRQKVSYIVLKLKSIICFPNSLLT